MITSGSSTPLISKEKPGPSSISTIWLVLSILLTVAVLILAQVFGEPTIPLFLIAVCIGLGFVVLIFLRPIWGLYLLVLLLFSVHWLTDSLQILPKPFVLIPDVLVITVFWSGIFHRLRRKGTLPRTPIDSLVLAFVAVATFSHLLNQSDSLLVFLNGLFRQNLKFILLFYAIVYLSPTDRILRRLVVFIVTLALLQIPVTIVQFFIYRSGQITVGPYQTLWDLADGTLGTSATGVLSILSLMIMCLLLGFAQTTRKWRYAVLGFSFFIPATLGEGKIVFVLAPLMILFLLIDKWAILRAQTILLVGSFAVIFVTSLVALQLILPEANSLDILLSPSYALQNYERGLADTGGFPRSRFGDIEFMIQLLSVDSTKAFWGYGPGSTSYAFTDVANGSLYNQFASYRAQPYFYFGITQLSTTAIEYGYVGLAIYFLLALRAHQANLKVLSRKGDKFWQAVAWGFRGVVFVFLVSIVYIRVWSLEILASTFWMLAGILVIHGQQLLTSSVTEK